MKNKDFNILEQAFNILNEYKEDIETHLEGSVLFVYDKDGYSFTESFKSKQQFFERFKEEEFDCEGFSYTLWNEGKYDRILSNGLYYHLVKLAEIKFN